MSKDPQLPNWLAKLVIAELADIHALVQSIGDLAISESAFRFRDIGMTEEEAVKRAKDIFESDRKPRAQKFYDDLLRRLNSDASLSPKNQKTLINKVILI
jgi:hypothetical protein